MRIIVVGATGNVGTSVVTRLAANPAVDEIVGLARRQPSGTTAFGSTGPGGANVTWVSADVVSDDLVPLFTGADVVIHLAWRIQPARDGELLYRTNVGGSGRVIDAVVRAEVPSLVYASSVGTYAPGSKDNPVSEAWPATGIVSSFYSRHKAEVEALLDAAEAAHPDLRIVRLRKALVFKRSASSEIARLFLGPLVPLRLLGHRRVPVVPRHDRLRFQVVHSDDAAVAYETAALGSARGPFNIATEPIVDASLLAEVFGARAVPVPASALRAAAAASFSARLQPTPPGWVDMALSVPTMDISLARTALGWQPRHDAYATFADLLDGFAEHAGAPTPPLEPARGGRMIGLLDA